MSKAFPRGRARIILWGAMAAMFALALILSLFGGWWPGMVEAQGRPPARSSIQGYITIVNGSQGVGAYLGEGDSLWFKVRPSKALRPVAVTPAISEANYFYFTYASGHSGNKAKLVELGTDSAGQYLLYRHVIEAGVHGTEPSGLLYYRSLPEATYGPASSAALQAVDGSGQFKFENVRNNLFHFNGPYDSSALSGTVQVQGPGSTQGGRSRDGEETYHPVSGASDVYLVSPPAHGWYYPGEEIVLRAVFSGRLIAAPEPSAAMRENAVRLRVGPNTGNTTTLRNAHLSEVGNAGAHGYVEYRYTVTAADADTDGVQLWSTQIAGDGLGYVCPEYAGPDCGSANYTGLSLGRARVMDGARVMTSELAWADDAEADVVLVKDANYVSGGDYGVIGGLTGALAGYPVYYSTAGDLPAGMNLENRNGKAALYGTPAATGTGLTVTIMGEDTTGRRAKMPVTIAVVASGAVSLPDNADGSYHGDTYIGAPDAGGVDLPAATGAGRITYLVETWNRIEWTEQLGVCFSYDGDATRPGRLQYRNVVLDCESFDGVVTERFRLTATGVGPEALTDVMEFTYTVRPGSPAGPAPTPVPPVNLDADGNGLIEIRTAEQLMAIRLDPDGNGRLNTYGAGVGVLEYFANALLKPLGGFPGYQQASGCPETGCRGYELKADIDLADLESWWQRADNFRPLTLYSTHPEADWTAVFEGNGHTISGLDFNTPSRSRVGLFGRIGVGGVVRNVGLVSPRLSGDQAVGAVAGVNRGLIETVWVSGGTVTAASSGAGLLVGENRGQVRKFWATGSVTAPESVGSAAGGNYGAGQVSQGWTDGFTAAAIPLSLSQGSTVVTGYSGAEATVTGAVEVDERAATAADNVKVYLVTEAALRSATTGVGSFSWDAESWDYGDGCQRPALKSGGHDLAKQVEGRLAACAATP